MKSKYSISFFIFAAFTTLQIHAQKTNFLGLQQAIDLGIKNSKELHIAQAGIEEATAAVKAATDNRLPDFKISGSYIRLSNATVDQKSGSQNSGNNPPPSINQALYGSANLSLPLFTGGKLKYGIESARFLEQATKLDAGKNMDDVVFNCTRAFINLYKAFETVTLVEENLSSSLSRDSTFSNLEKNGLLARNDLLKSQLQTSNLELAVLEAKKNYKLATVNMNLMLGLPEQDTIIMDTSFMSDRGELKNYSDYETIALQNRSDLRAAAFRQKAASSEIKLAKAASYPNLALTGGYIAAYVPGFITITNAVNIGLGVQYNLASLWKTNTNLIRAKAMLQQNINRQDMLNDAIKMELNQDYQECLLSNKKIEVHEKALQQASENYRITSNKYQNNLVTLTELLEADVARLQAGLNMAFARADAILAYKKLMKTTGLQ